MLIRPLLYFLLLDVDVSSLNVFRKAGPGLGGPYLLPNMHALVYLCEHFHLHEQAVYWRAVIQMDEYQRRRLIEIVIGHISSFKGKRAAVLGFLASTW
jgi:UDPglucose 6-dehydrogenase